ncbi:ABC transporter ATP-binding protein [Sphingobacterium sp. MYb382]|uniref:ABC transporter ATP-binding protein n=1 Tax=Sphingobacterium sp. MYb382 TaxID=2745278 RepID=UPI0030A9ED50
MIEIKNVSFHYKKGKDILNDINTTLAPGQVYGLFGLNGCGKTTLLKLISSSIYAKSGILKVGDYTVSERQRELLSDLYLVTDEVDLPNWKITDILRVYSPLYPKFDRHYFDEILNKFQVAAQARIKDLSYGQRKKVNIAFALASNVSLLLMDEPTNGLDIPSKTQFRKLIVNHLDSEKTIIISTHQTRDVQNLIDHMLVIKENKLILDASIFELSKRFSFKQGNYPEAFYAESNYNGTLSLVPNSDNEDTPFDIEIFFNALHENPVIPMHLKTTNLHHHAE